MRSYKRLLSSVATLPTITESHEDLSQSLEEYMNSIKELAQPACGPLRISRTQRRKPMGKHVTLRFNSQVDRGSKDPLDWLFGEKDKKNATRITILPSASEYVMAVLAITDIKISAHFHFHRSGIASHRIIPLSNIIQNIFFCVQHKKKFRTGLEQHERK
uniref:Uncharacterized protein n=1 Tax=Sinocyclocheilus anshuiensis TaxID=1608454 RepID=A0A671QFX6_9TELE